MRPIILNLILKIIKAISKNMVKVKPNGLAKKIKFVSEASFKKWKSIKVRYNEGNVWSWLMPQPQFTWAHTVWER